MHSKLGGYRMFWRFVIYVNLIDIDLYDRYSCINGLINDPVNNALKHFCHRHFLDFSTIV